MGLVWGLVTACAPSPVPSDEGGADGTAGSVSSDPATTTGPGATSMSMASASGATSGEQGDTTTATSAVGDTSGSEGGGETSETSAGLGTSTGEIGTSSGGEEVVCLDPFAGVAWAGDWGKWWGPACMYTAGVPEPVVVNSSGFGNDCTILMADVWIPGVTDVDGNQALIRRRMVIEDLAGVPVDEIYMPGVGFNGRFGNNYRFSFSFQGGGWGYVPYGTYRYRLQLSYLEENDGCWYTIGLGDGPDGGEARTLIWEEWTPP